jgi:LysM repeat protein
MLLVSLLCFTAGCSGTKPVGTGTPESRAQAAALVRDRELELTALRAELAATRIAAAKKEAELQELRDLVQQLRLENAESRQAFLELRDRIEQRQGEVEKVREEQERQAQAQTTQHLTLLKDTLVSLAQELGQLRQDLAKPVLKDRKPGKPGASRGPDSSAPDSRTDTPQRIPSALPQDTPGRSAEGSVRTISSQALTDKPRTITVQPSDTLWSLAMRHRTSVSVLRELNHVEGEALAVGQVLTLPVPTSP